MKNLKTISFSIHIASDRKNVWNVLWNPNTYQIWSSIFTEGSHFKGELKQGHSIQFLGKDGGGISSRIEKLIENEQIVFYHQKQIKNGLETNALWQGTKEMYYLKKETDSDTRLQVILESTPEMENYFNKVFPQALALVKQISEEQ